MATRKPSKAVTRRGKKTAVATMDFSKDAGAGVSFGQQDLTIPFIRALQSNSPETSRADPGYIPGSEEGMLFNTVTNEMFDGEEGVLIVPCRYERCFIEWRLREQGGGFVAKHDSTSKIMTTCVKDSKGRFITPEDTQIQETAQYMIMQLDDKREAVGPAMIGLVSSNLSEARRWNSVMQGITGKSGKATYTKPMYSQIYRVTSQPRSNEKGSWFVLHFEHEAEITDEKLYQECKLFNQSTMGEKNAA